MISSETDKESSTAAVTEGNSLTLIAILVQQSMRKVYNSLEGGAKGKEILRRGELPGIRDVAN